MARDISFRDYIIYDLMLGLPGITTKPLFSGWGIYKNGVIFAIIIDGQLYFKLNESNRAEFKIMQSHPFTYERADGKKVSMAYWSVPEEIMESRHKLHGLINLSVS